MRGALYWATKFEGYWWVPSNFFRAFVRVKDYLDIISATSDVIVFRQVLMDFYSRNHVSNLQPHSSNTFYTKSHLNSFKQQLWAERQALVDVESTKPVISVMLNTPRSMRQSDTKRGSRTVIWLMTPVRNSTIAVISSPSRSFNWLCNFRGSENYCKQVSTWGEGILDQMNLNFLWLTYLKRQNEPDPMGQEEAEFKKDPTLPVCLPSFPWQERRV